MEKISLSLSKNYYCCSFSDIESDGTMIANFSFEILMFKKKFQKFLDIFNTFENTYDIGNDCFICMKNMID